MREITEARFDAEKRGLRNARFIVGDVLQEPNPVHHGTFDAVLLIRFLTCFPVPDQRHRVLSTARTALKPRGLLYVRDFLLSPTYRARYDAAVRNGLSYGDFPVLSANGVIQFVAHHHSEAEARAMVHDYEPLLFEYEESLSMNGNPCTMFEFIGRRAES